MFALLLKQNKCFEPAGTKQMRTTENKSFGTHTKQMLFNFASAGTKQMGKNWINHLVLK